MLAKHMVDLESSVVVNDDFKETPPLDQAGTTKERPDTDGVFDLVDENAQPGVQKMEAVTLK